MAETLLIWNGVFGVGVIGRPTAPDAAFWITTPPVYRPTHFVRVVPFMEAVRLCRQRLDISEHLRQNDIRCDHLLPIASADPIIPARLWGRRIVVGWTRGTPAEDGWYVNGFVDPESASDAVRLKLRHYREP